MSQSSAPYPSPPASIRTPLKTHLDFPPKNKGKTSNLNMDSDSFVGRSNSQASSNSYKSLESYASDATSSKKKVESRSSPKRRFTKRTSSSYDRTPSFSPKKLSKPQLDIDVEDLSSSFKCEEFTKPLKSPRERMKSMRSMLSKSTRLASDDFSLFEDDSSLASELSIGSPCEISSEALLTEIKPSSNMLVEAELELLERLKKSGGKSTALPVLVSLKEVLEETEDSAAQHIALQIVNFLCEHDPTQLELCSTTGVLGVTLLLAGDESPREVRVELAYLVGQYCHSTDEVMKVQLMQLFLAAGGLEALAKLLDLDFETNKDLVLLALDCMNKVSDLQRHEYLVVWCSLGVPERLALTLQNLMSESMGYLLKTLDLLLDFASGPPALKQAVCQEEVLNILVFALHSVHEKPLLTLLQVFEALSLERDVLAVRVI